MKFDVNAMNNHTKESRIKNCERSLKLVKKMIKESASSGKYFVDYKYHTYITEYVTEQLEILGFKVRIILKINNSTDSQHSIRISWYNKPNE